jgi:hypothetical protein
MVYVYIILLDIGFGYNIICVVSDEARAKSIEKELSNSTIGKTTIQKQCVDDLSALTKFFTYKDT